MTKHTPGPWKAYFSVHGDPSVVTDANRPAFTKICDVSTSQSDYGQANCRLLAAAPELLAAAKLVREFFECIELNSLQRFAATDCKRMIESAVRKAEE